jgi:hypothetical protein
MVWTIKIRDMNTLALASAEYPCRIFVLSRISAMRAIQRLDVSATNQSDANGVLPIEFAGRHTNPLS